MADNYSLPDKVHVAVDVVLFTIQRSELKVLLVKRLIEPFAGGYALPGGFVLADESLEHAAMRELQEETGFKAHYLEQLQSFGDPGRDPRGRVVTVAYFALLPSEQTIQPGTDAVEAGWFSAHAAPALAFDHDRILAVALRRLQGKLDYSGVGFDLLPDRFTLSELQAVHEAIHGHPLDKRNFRRKLEAGNQVAETNEMKPTGRKPARLYRFIGPR
jgi:8-oxo-dGTP diphosphatase